VPPRNQGWIKQNHGIAGGSVWNNLVIDSNTNALYIGTGNPAPLFYGANRPGPDPWTDSIVALNALTGRFLWGFSTIPHDLWDYDDAANPILFPTPLGMGVGEAGKSGIWDEALAANGEQITAPLFFMNGPNAAEVEDFGKPAGPVPIFGDPWSPEAYDPQTRLVYVVATNATSMITSSAKNDRYVPGKPQGYGGSGFLHPKVLSSNVTAIDPVSGTITWQHLIPGPYVSEGGPTTTAGGLVFAQQTQTGTLLALDARTGRLLWSAHPGGAIGGGPSVYSVGGREYVLVPLGGGGLAAGVGKVAGKPDAWVAYTLGG
jgi:alcohol dehydrogenase (cytochrome c)